MTSSTDPSHTSPYQSRISALARDVQPRVLVYVQGSGNYGESGRSAFYTFDKLPAALEAPTTMHPSSALQRIDLDLGPNRLAFTVDNVLTPDEADALAACAEAVLEQNGHSRLAPGIRTPPGMRVNEAAHWFAPPSSSKLSNDEDEEGDHACTPSFWKAVFDRVRPLLPPTLDGLPLYEQGLSEKVAQFKYNVGDEFRRHTDGMFPGQGINAAGNGVDEWVGVQSGLSMLLYLNDYEKDGLVGGETRLWSADGTQYTDVTPRKGRALFFRRGSSTAVLHAGLPVLAGRDVVPKYMALVNVCYGRRTGTGSLA